MTVLAGDKSVYKPHLEPCSAPTARCRTEETWFPLRSVGQIDGGCAQTNVPSLQFPGAGTSPAEIPAARENSSTNQEQNWFSSDLILQVLHGPGEAARHSDLLRTRAPPSRLQQNSGISWIK